MNRKTKDMKYVFILFYFSFKMNFYLGHRKKKMVLQLELMLKWHFRKINDAKNANLYDINFKSKYNYEIFGDKNPTELILSYKLKGEENKSYILFDEQSDTFCHVISCNNIINKFDKIELIIHTTKNSICN